MYVRTTFWPSSVQQGTYIDVCWYVYMYVLCIHVYVSMYIGWSYLGHRYYNVLLMYYYIIEGT